MLEHFVKKRSTYLDTDKKLQRSETYCYKFFTHIPSQNKVYIIEI